MLDSRVADMMEAMTASLVYLLLRQVLQMLTQLARDGGAKDVETAPRSALSYSQFSWEEFGGTFLGLMAYLNPKGNLGTIACQ